MGKLRTVDSHLLKNIIGLVLTKGINFTWYDFEHHGYLYLDAGV